MSGHVGWCGEVAACRSVVAGWRPCCLSGWRGHSQYKATLVFGVRGALAALVFMVGRAMNFRYC